MEYVVLALMLVVGIILGKNKLSEFFLSQRSKALVKEDQILSKKQEGLEKDLSALKEEAKSIEDEQKNKDVKETLDFWNKK